MEQSPLPRHESTSVIVDL